MVRLIDIECDLPTREVIEFRRNAPGSPPPGSGDTFRGREPQPLDGYGMANYGRVFRGREQAWAEPAVTLDEFADRLGALGVERAVIGTSSVPSNAYAAEVIRARPDRFLAFACISPWDGMRGVRELERLVREDGLCGLTASTYRERLPGDDARWYPLYAKCVELGIPVRIYSAMTYANDRPYDIGHPRHLDRVAVDFPELTIIAALGGWPWVSELVPLMLRHPKLYCDTAAHRPRTLTRPGSGWEMLLQLGNHRLQDKVMVGISSLTIGVAYETLLAEVLELPLADQVMEKWLYHNAARVLGIA
jgi:predicted TIM-barrel fold metal-dependent hydrolase